MELPTPSQPNSDSATWPRRTAKACASCRRDKIRCDGARPCAGCVRKGFTPDQCIDGCEHCRRDRVRCEGGKPCQRCRELGLECAEESASHATRHDPLLNLEPRPTRPSTNDRAKLACQACRRDNKKCDDARPCSRCISRSEECIHVGRGPKLVKLRCQVCRRDNKRCEDSRPCKYCVDNGHACVNVARKGRGHGTRVKAACTNCRRDKIRCNGNRPCEACARKGYDCTDRACKTCTLGGKELECTHRRPMDAGSDDGADDQQDANVASSSQQVPLPLAPHHMPHPHAPGPGIHYGLGPLPHYYPPPPPRVPQLQPGMQHVLYQTPAYYPVIDPNIDGPPPMQTLSSEPPQGTAISPSQINDPGAHP